MKLSEPQKRALKLMWRRKLHVRVVAWQDGYWTATWMRPDYKSPRFLRQPNVRTLRSLERKGLLQREPKEHVVFRLVLTPKGREIAKELQDAKD